MRWLVLTVLLLSCTPINTPQDVQFVETELEIGEASLACIGEEVMCDGVCTWIHGDPLNCGECGYVCGDHGYHAYVCIEYNCHCPTGWVCGN